jgi:small subunit ribosomal protein S5
VNSQTALVIAGNGRGLVGWGVGRGNDEMSALNKAKTMVTKNCIYVPRFEGRTIPYVVIGKHNNTRVKLVPKLRGATMVASPLMGTILDMAGMRDISAKVLGNRNIFSQIYAVFDALSKVPSIPEHTRARGHKVRACARSPLSLRAHSPRRAGVPLRRPLSAAQAAIGRAASQDPRADQRARVLGSGALGAHAVR